MKNLYHKYPDYRDRVLIIYIVLSIFVCLFFAISFIYENAYGPAILQSISIIGMLVSLGFLQCNKITISRFLSVITSYSIVAIQVFVYFPPSVGFHYQYLALLVVAFTIFKSNDRKQLFLLLGFTILLCATFILIEAYPTVFSKIELSQDAVVFYFYCSIIATFGGIYIVLLFFSFELSRTRRELQYLATTDSLTGLFNRRTFLLYGNESFQSARYSQKTFCILMIDVDHFKSINDTYGHMAGDIVLKELGILLKESFRKTDYIARYGGEEFSIILPDTSCDNGVVISDQIRNLIENKRFILHGGQQIQLTVSIGVACFEQHYESFDNLLSEADSALYKAKEIGRNCIYKYNFK